MLGYSVTDTQDILTGRVSFVASGEIRGIGGRREKDEESDDLD